jgi:hypothetical protein
MAEVIALAARRPQALVILDDLPPDPAVVLEMLPALMGGAIPRLRGRSRWQSPAADGLALGAAMVVVAVKDFLGH